jgi:GAF domain-containing protein
MLNTKVLDWIEGYVITRVLIFGDFIGTVKRQDLLIDLDTKSDYFRRYEGQRIQALTLPVKSRDLSTLLGEIEACFQRGWPLLDAGKWTEEDFDQVYQLSRQISEEIMFLRMRLKEQESKVKISQS